jgi:hypothetical protein
MSLPTSASVSLPAGTQVVIHTEIRDRAGELTCLPGALAVLLRLSSGLAFIQNVSATTSKPSQSPMTLIGPSRKNI